MASKFPPPTMKAWQFSSTAGGIEKNLKINPAAPLPVAKPDQHLVQVIAVALNPVDYKPIELPLVGRLFVSKPATPCIDFAGCVVTPAAGSSVKPGDLIFGAAGTGSPFSTKGLAEFTLAAKNHVVAVPHGVDAVDAATICVAGITAYQSIVPRVKRGDKLFINGGSGGTGTFGIQMAKAVGCHVTTTCSTRNVELCKSLGADEVIDYTKGDVLEALKATGHQFDHVVDNVGKDLSLYLRCYEFTTPDAVYIKVAGEISLQSLKESFKATLWNTSQRKREGFWPKPKPDDLEQIARWMKEGKVKAVIDHRFPFEQAREAFEKLKTGRARGKIVIDVASETYRKAWPQ